MIKIIGIVIFLASIYSWYLAGSRAFNRTNEFGTMVFESFGEVLLFRITQGILWIVAYGGLMVGFMLFCVGYGFGR